MKNTKSGLLKKIVSLMIAATFVFSGTINAYACTSFYMGKGTTENGAVIWGRSEDIGASYRKLHKVYPAATHEPGEYYTSSTGFKWPYPEKTLRYTVVVDSVLNENITPQPYGEVGMNEMNVAMSSTVTLSGAKSAITSLDPMVSASRGGLAETDTASIVLMQATSARHGCEILAEIVSTVGAAGREGTMISDPDEVWYFQILSGHQYIAVKAPDDMVGFSPNITGNVDVSDKENVIASPGLISIAEQVKTIVLDEDGNIKIADSYANTYTSLGRMWLGYYYLKDKAAADAVKSGYLDYFTAPREAGNYTLYEALRLLAFRGEGTEKDAGSATGNGSSIGNDGTVEAHVFETRDNMPDALATIEWLSMAPPEFGVYIPSYGSLITEVFDKYYTPDTKTYDDNNPDNNSVYSVFRELYTLCKGPRGATGLGSRELRTRYGGDVIKFWERYQKSLIAQQAEVDKYMTMLYEVSPAGAKKIATQLYSAISEEAYTYAKQILSELKAFQAAGTAGNFTPSALLKEDAVPNYSSLLKYDSYIIDDNDVNINASMLFENNSDKAVDLTMVAAVYSSEGKLLGFAEDSEKIEAGKAGGFSVTLDKPENTVDNTVKAFLWNSDTLIPVMDFSEF